MINKFQQGGKQDAVMQFVLGLALTLLADPLQVILIAQQNPQALEAAILTYQQTKDIKLAAQTFQQAVQLQTQAARHGAKLNYIKSLKNQCAEDEEVVYYKKGGSVGCGCKKKEDGGEIKKAEQDAIAKFKAARKMQSGGKPRTKEQQEKINKLSEEDYFNGTADHTKPGTSQNPVLKFKTRSKAELERINKLSEKDYFAGTADHRKPGKKCNGGAVKKFKMHRQGGSLNSIPFYLSGTSKKGIKWNKRTEPITYGGIQEGERTWYTYPSFVNNKDSIVIQRDIRPRQFLTNVGYRRDPSNLDTTYYFSAPKEPTIFSKDDPRVKILFERINKKYK